MCSKCTSHIEDNRLEWYGKRSLAFFPNFRRILLQLYSTAGTAKIMSVSSTVLLHSEQVGGNVATKHTEMKKWLGGSAISCHLSALRTFFGSNDPYGTRPLYTATAQVTYLHESSIFYSCAFHRTVNMQVKLHYLPRSMWHSAHVFFHPSTVAQCGYLTDNFFSVWLKLLDNSLCNGRGCDVTHQFRVNCLITVWPLIEQIYSIAFWGTSHRVAWFLSWWLCRRPSL